MLGLVRAYSAMLKFSICSISIMPALCSPDPTHLRVAEDLGNLAKF